MLTDAQKKSMKKYRQSEKGRTAEKMIKVLESCLED